MNKNNSVSLHLKFNHVFITHEKQIFRLEIFEDKICTQKREFFNW
jgi:hypothetical protein